MGFQTLRQPHFPDISHTSLRPNSGLCHIVGQTTIFADKTHMFGDGFSSFGGILVSWTSPEFASDHPKMADIAMIEYSFTHRNRFCLWPPGKLLQLWKISPCLLANSTISCVIFDSKLLVYQRVQFANWCINKLRSSLWSWWDWRIDLTRIEMEPFMEPGKTISLKGLKLGKSTTRLTTQYPFWPTRFLLTFPHLDGL